MTENKYQPKQEQKSTFGLCTVGNRGADPFGAQVREKLSAPDIVKMLGELGAYGVNFHDNDLVPIDATASERDQIVKDFRKACGDYNIKVPGLVSDKIDKQAKIKVDLVYEPLNK